jgi:hypothetical protein
LERAAIAAVVSTNQVRVVTSAPALALRAQGPFCCCDKPASFRKQRERLTAQTDSVDSAATKSENDRPATL